MNPRLLFTAVILTSVQLFFSPLQASSRDSLRATDYYIEGVRLYTAGDLDKAASLFGKCIALDSSHDAANYYLSLISLSRGNTDKALEYINTASALSPENPWYRQTAAKLYLSIGETGMATEVYEELIAIEPKNSYYYDLVDIYARSGQNDKAIGVLDKIEEMRGMTEMTGSARYELLVMQGKYTEAEEVIKKLDEKFPSARTSLIIGDMYKAKYDDSTALYYYNRALDMDPDFTAANFGIAETYRILRKYDLYFRNINRFLSDPKMIPYIKAGYIEELLYLPGMVQSFMPQLDTMVTNTLKAHPSDTAVLMLAGTYYLGTDRPDTGLVYLKKNIELHPDVRSARSAYMTRLYMLQKWDELIEAAIASVNAFPDEAPLKEYLAIAYWQSGDIPSAIRVYEEILHSLPDDHPMTINCLASIGDLYHETGNRKKAYSSYEKGLKLNPDYTPILNNYAYYLGEEGKKLNKALSMSKKTVELDPENPTYLDTYGWLLYITGDYAQAREYLKKATIYGGKENAAILDHFAEALFALKEYNLAFLYWSNADKLDPGLGLADKIARKRKEIGQK